MLLLVFVEVNVTAQENPTYPIRADGLRVIHPPVLSFNYHLNFEDVNITITQGAVVQR
jgi:hypothetical protein